MYKRLNPVPLLSYSVRYHKADAGVMVTASHNPPEYNGYKVYWSDGAQVTPPNDQNIINHYNKISDFGVIRYLDFESGVSKKLIHMVGDDVENSFFKDVLPYFINTDLCKSRGKELKIIYTPIHGSGKVPCSKMLDLLGLTNYKIVKEQELPDGNFPTVGSPNPENPSALAMAVELLKKDGADLVMGTDPDADRLGVALIHNKDVVYLTGNQMGTLMLHYILHNLNEKNKLPAQSYVIKTIVTTELQATIAEHYGVTVHNTLTGFKWICGKEREIEQKNPKAKFLFGTEESFGYLNHPFVRDKDAVTAVGLMGEMALWYKTKNMDLVDALDAIYDEFGFAYEDLLCLDYHGKEGAEKINRIMEQFRRANLKEICGEAVVKIQDYAKGVADLPKSNVLEYVMASGNKLLLRPSGTEPKIKFYILLQEKNGALSEKKKNAVARSKKIVEFIQKEAARA